jgi:hypothetical protein
MRGKPWRSLTGRRVRMGTQPFEGSLRPSCSSVRPSVKGHRRGSAHRARSHVPRLEFRRWALLAADRSAVAVDDDNAGKCDTALTRRSCVRVWSERVRVSAKTRARDDEQAPTRECSFPTKPRVSGPSMEAPPRSSWTIGESMSARGGAGPLT